MKANYQLSTTEFAISKGIKWSVNDLYAIKSNLTDRTGEAWVDYSLDHAEEMVDSLISYLTGILKVIHSDLTTS